MDSFEEVARLICGDGVDELIQKREQTKEEKERKQAIVALGGNMLGLGAGVAALAAASKQPALRSKKATPKHAGPVTSRLVRYNNKLKPKALRTALATPKGKARLIQAGAAGAVGLQAANTGGDVVGNIVLRREAKKKGKPAPESARVVGLKEVKHQTYDKVAKSSPDKADLHLIGAGGKEGKLRTLPTKSRKKPMVVCKWEGEISKVNQDKQQVFGWASITEINGEPVIDLQGDYIHIDEVEKSAYDYVVKSRHGGDMHARDGEKPKVIGTMIESMVVTPEKREQMGLPDTMPTGWWVGFQVEDPDVWQMVKSGERTGFSIHGRGMREAAEI